MIRYAHTNLITRDWRRLVDFYVSVFGCVPVPPERDLSGDWLSKGTGVDHAHITGMHLRLPGHGENGPTLEIFCYDEVLAGLPKVANREGFGHLAFEVDSVEEMMEKVLAKGGGKVGECVVQEVPGAGVVTFAYVTDPDGNILELQRWEEE